MAGPPAFTVRGLVLGYIQSGKTANISALIDKRGAIALRRVPGAPRIFFICGVHMYRTAAVGLGQVQAEPAEVDDVGPQLGQLLDRRLEQGARRPSGVTLEQQVGGCRAEGAVFVGDGDRHSADGTANLTARSSSVWTRSVGAQPLSWMRIMRPS